MSSVVVHYGELALKGRNRPWFINTLVRTIRAALRGPDVSSVRALMGRIEIRLGPARDWDECGIGWRGSRHRELRASRTHVPPDHRRDCGRDPSSEPSRSTCRGRSASRRRRADKRFPIPSPEIEREVGGRMQAATGWPVNLADPELTIHVEVAHRRRLLLLRARNRAPAAAGRHERQGDVPALRRHRFAGGGVAHDAPRLPRRCSCTSTAIRSCRARRRTRRASWCGC